MLWLLAAAAVLPSGCTRRFFRSSADREVEDVITAKNCFDAWRVEQFHVYPDSRARFADPTNPDRPPMPTDDPAAKLLSPNPQKPPKAGVATLECTGYIDLLAGWDAQNRGSVEQGGVGRGAWGVERKDGQATLHAPRPTHHAPPLQQVQYLPDALPGAARVDSVPQLRTNEQPFLIKLEQASELGLINSREFQDSREDLYLAALPVTLQRFAFATQFFAIDEIVREYTGRQTPEGRGNRWRNNSQLGFSKLFPTGALLLVRLANQVIVNMAAEGGTPRVTTPSTISLDIAQPLLQGGGRAVTLEPLTQVERSMLYAVRAYARFRKEFYVAIAGGGEFGFNFAPDSTVIGTGNAPTEGYLPILFRYALLANERQNVVQLESGYRLYQALAEGGDVSQLQVDQIEQRLLQGRSTVLNRTLELRDALDRFKQQLGVPVSVPLDLDDGPLRPLTDQLQRFQEVIDQFEALREAAGEFNPKEDPAKLRDRLRALAFDSPLVRNTRFRDEFPARWKAWEDRTDDQLRQRLEELRAERKLLLQRKDDPKERQGFSEADRLRLAAVEREIDLGRFERSLRRYAVRPWARPNIDDARRRAEQATAFGDATDDFALVMSEARAERIDLGRARWPALPPACLDGIDLVADDLDRATVTASQAALTNRLDLMNARGRLTDSWRQIAVRANALMGVVDVNYHLDSFTPPLGAKPFDFDASRSRHQLRINTELPLVRKLERNNYRTALIAYQRGRRTLQQAEDQVLTAVRAEIRQLRVLAENYKIQQRAIELAYFQVENSRNVIQAPPRPSTGGPGGTGTSGTGGGGDAGSAAALTQQYLNALGSQVQAQNQLYSVYQNYLIVRMQLYRDIEQMPLDTRGVWINELVATDCPGAGPCGPGRPEPDNEPQWLPSPRPLDRGAVPAHAP